MIQALRNLGGGLAASLLSLAYCFSYGAFIFTGPLQPFLSQGVAAALITAAVTATIIALSSGFRSAIAGPDSNTTAVLAAMMVILAPTMAAMAPEQALVLALAAARAGDAADRARAIPVGLVAARKAHSLYSLSCGRRLSGRNRMVDAVRRSQHDDRRGVVMARHCRCLPSGTRS